METTPPKSNIVTGYRLWKSNLKARWSLYSGSLRKSQNILALSRRPVVIGGCGRSGTTLVLSVLSCHPHIFAINDETRALSPGTVNNPMVGAPFKMDRIYKFLLDRPIPDECTRWCEKTPRNVLHFEVILQRFGEAVRIINVVRDGRDVVTSRHPTDPSRYWVDPSTWVRDVKAGMRVEKHPQVLTIRFEDLVLDYESTVRKICAFIDEDFLDTFRDYPASARVRQNAAWFSEARPIDPSVIGKWKKPEFAAPVEALLENPQAIELLMYYRYL